MGADPHAKIIYGFPFTGEGCDAYYDDPKYQEDSQDWLEENQGIVKPTGLLEANRPEWDDYYKASRNTPITVEYEGDLCNGCLTDYLCIREATISGTWDGPTAIPLDHVREAPQEWHERLKAFCDKTGIGLYVPKWLLIVSYG